MTLDSTIAAWGGLGGFATALALLGPARALWRRGHLRRLTHRLDHEGRPARIDPSTGRVIEAAQPGIASMVSDIHTRQADIAAKVATLADNSTDIRQIHQLLKEQALENDKRHAENGAATAKLGVRVMELQTLAHEAAAQAADAAGHATRIDRQQAEMREEVLHRFDEHQVIEQAYVRALAELGIAVDPPPADRH